MEFQKIFKSKTIHTLKSSILSDKILAANYLNKKLDFKESDFLLNRSICVDGQMQLIIPDANKNYDFENAKIIFERYKTISPVEASDERLWTYLSHVDCWDYMKKRYSKEKQKKEKQKKYLINHWLLDGISPNSLMRHGISLLWWGAFTTYDKNKADPYELTKELFSMLDYTRTITTGSLGRNKNFTHAFLEFVLENKELFKRNKEAKVRFAMRKMNSIGGYNIISSLEKKEIKDILSKYKKSMEKLVEVGI